MQVIDGWRLGKTQGNKGLPSSGGGLMLNTEYGNTESWPKPAV